MSKFDLTHVQHDPSHCLAPGLFKSLKRGDYKSQKLDVTYEYSNKESLRFTGFEPLGGPEMRLLQVLVAMAGPSDMVLNLDAPASPKGQQLATLLEPKEAALTDKSRVIESSMYRLLNEMGLGDTGPNRAAVMASLYRLANVTIKVSSPGQTWIMKLLSYRYDEDLTGKLDSHISVALNGRITAAVMGSKTSYTRLEMSEVRAIKGDPTRLIHQRLCGWLNQGDTRPVEIDTLCSYAWPDGKTKEQSDEQWAEVLKYRRRTLKGCMAELSTLGWSFMGYGVGKLRVTRPEPVA
jgi:hypothetical protein